MAAYAQNTPDRKRLSLPERSEALTRGESPQIFRGQQRNIPQETTLNCITFAFGYRSSIIRCPNSTHLTRSFANLQAFSKQFSGLMASPMRIERKPLPGDLKKEPTLESDLELDLSDVEAKEERATVPSKSMRVLGWEITAHRAPPPTSPQTSRPRTGRFAAFHEKFDQAVPPNQKYLGRSRRTFLIVVGLILFVLICLVIGLAVGLTIGRRGYMISFLVI